MRGKIVLFFLIILLTACGASATTKPTKEIRDTPNQSTEIPSPTSFITNTPIPPSPTTQIPMTATLQVLQNKLDKYCKHGQAWGVELSPNDQWKAVFCSYDIIEIVRNDESKNWELSSDTLINPYTEYFASVSHWSNDGNYVYVSFDPHTDGFWEPFHQGVVLYRLNLETGQISEVLPLGKSDWIFYSFAFSPNDRRLAYIVTDKSPVTLNIRDMQTGDEQSFEFEPKYNTGGGFIWSPDSQMLVFSITQFDTSNYEYVATSVVLWEREKPTTTTLIKDFEKALVPVEWLDQTRIKLQILYEQDSNYKLDLTNNELEQISP